MTEQHRGRRAVRWISEAALIVASVFLAIFLEGLADDASRQADATRSLRQLASQLRADSADLTVVRDRQVALGTDYDHLLRWLQAPGSMPNDSVQESLDAIAWGKTMYPRKGAWEAITSTGQLAWVGDQDLVTRLANLYGSQLDKLEFMGKDYDFNVNEFSRVVASRAWDWGAGAPNPIEGAAGVVEMRGQLRYLRWSWNVYYLDLIDEYGTEVNELLRDLDEYLADGGA